MGQKATIVSNYRHEAAALQAMFHDMFAYQSGLSIRPWNYVSLLILGRWPLDSPTGERQSLDNLVCDPRIMMRARKDGCGPLPVTP
jgi:hypothetical protein